MTADRDITPVVRSWLRTDEHESADRVLDNVLAMLDTTPQRRSWWPARRSSDMNTYAKFAIAAAAVLVVAIVGFNLMPGSGTPSAGGVAPSPTPSATASPTAIPSATPTATSAAIFPPEGPIDAGTYMAVMEGVPVSFEIPGPGWSTDGWGIGTGTYPESDFLGFRFWDSAPENIYSDPCAHTPLSPPPSPTAEGLTAAVAAMPGTNLVSGPETVEIGGLPAQHVAVKIRNDIGCDPEDFYLWYDDQGGGPLAGYVWGSALASTHHAWAIDVDGKVLWIDAETFKGAGPEIGQALQQFIDSIQFE
jgi:hypothetical protein